MTDDFEERLFDLAERHFPSLDSLHAFFATQMARTESMAEKLELRAAAQVATEHHVARVAAEADAPVPTPPRPSRAPTRASEDITPPLSAEPRLKSLDEIEKHFGRLIKQAGEDERKVRELQTEEQQAKADLAAAAAAEDEKFLQKWGGPIGLSFGVGSPKSKVRTSDRGGRNEKGESQGVAEAAASPEQEVRGDGQEAAHRSKDQTKGVKES